MPRAQRRVSGPLGGQDRPSSTERELRFAPHRRSPRPATPVGARASAFVRTLPDHALLDRVVRGRAWIPLLGVMLAGIVAMQVEVLGLGASVGRAIERSTALQSRNETLRASVASLADQQRIERLATGMGMVMPAPGAVGFLAAQAGGNAQQAAANIHAPDAAAFATATAAITTTPTTPTPTTTTTTSGATTTTSAGSTGGG